LAGGQRWSASRAAARCSRTGSCRRLRSPATLYGVTRGLRAPRSSHGMLRLRGDARTLELMRVHADHVRLCHQHGGRLRMLPLCGRIAAAQEQERHDRRARCPEARRSTRPDACDGAPRVAAPLPARRRLHPPLDERGQAAPRADPRSGRRSAALPRQLLSGTEFTRDTSALRCVFDVQFDPCFPPTADWNRSSVVVACAAAGSTTFGRFVITRRS
jgi:hypothetical protein